MTTTIDESLKAAVSAALKVLREGGLILYPTDTVWGIGCDACNEEAVKKVFALKRREDSKSLVLLASSLDMIAKYTEQIPEMAIQLVEVNDAPMTIIYPGATGLAPSCVAADGSVGIRIPDSSEFCMRLTYALGRPLVSTSANISGESTPKNFSEIAGEIKDGVDHIVSSEFEAAATGRSSQIIKVDLDGTVKIIRS